MPEQFMILLFAALGLLALAAISLKSGQGSLDGIKSKPVGDGQHGTARWATPKEIGQTFARVPFKRRSTARSGNAATSCPCSSWCRICWNHPG